MRELKIDKKMPQLNPNDVKGSFKAIEDYNAYLYETLNYLFTLIGRTGDTAYGLTPPAKKE